MRPGESGAFPVRTQARPDCAAGTEGDTVRTMDRQDELRARRDALETELLTLEQAIQGQWQRGVAAPTELLERVDTLLERLKQVNRALCEPDGAAQA